MTNMIGTDEEVLKTDTRGRMQMPAARRERLLDEFEQSGLSGKKFAALVGVKYPTFANWVQKRRRRRNLAPQASGKTGNAVRWLEAVVEQAQNPGTKTSSFLKLRLPGGAEVEIADTRQAVLAAALLRALEKPATSC
jgi:transposase-like protein